MPRGSVGQRITRAENACELARPWFLACDNVADDAPGCRVDGRPATVEEGIERAGAILRDARWPLVCGLAGATVEAQCAATSVAEAIGGLIDGAGRGGQRAAGLSFHRVAEVTVEYGDQEDILGKVILPNARSIARIQGSKLDAREFISGKTRAAFQDRLLSELRHECWQQGIDIKSALVRDILGLTLGEARIAALVGSGLPPRTAAERLGISEETARTVLKRVFAKVGVSRQTELSELLTRLVLRRSD